MINIDNKFDHGQVVYLITDENQLPRIVTSIIVNKYDILYEVINTTTVSRHYDFELTSEVNVLSKI